MRAVECRILAMDLGGHQHSWLQLSTEMANCPWATLLDRLSRLTLQTTLLFSPVLRQGTPAMFCIMSSLLSILPA
jgi:hypothetical protein